MLATVRLSISRNIPGARSPTLRPNWLLPGAVRDLLGDDGVAHGHDLVGQLAMQALALRRQGAFLVGQPTARRLVPLAVMPGLATPCAAALLVIVLRVVGPALTVQLALQTSFRSYPGGECGAKQAQPCFSGTGHDGNGGGSQVQSHCPLPGGVLRFLGGHPFQGQLDGVARAVPVRPFGAGTGGVASQEPDIFDAVPQQTIQDHGIRPVDERS